MLSKVKASRREIADWRTMTAVEKGRIRTAFNLWPKLAYHPSYYSLTMEVLGRDLVRTPDPRVLPA